MRKKKKKEKKTPRTYIDYKWYVNVISYTFCYYSPLVPIWYIDRETIYNKILLSTFKIELKWLFMAGSVKLAEFEPLNNLYDCEPTESKMENLKMD